MGFIIVSLTEKSVKERKMEPVQETMTKLVKDQCEKHSPGWPFLSDSVCPLKLWELPTP